jgi:hypothetical protein
VQTANLFVTSILYSFLTSSKISFLRLNFSTSKFCAVFYITAKLSLTFVTTIWWSLITITVNFLDRRYMENNRKPYPIYQYIISLVVSLPTKICPGVFINLYERPNLICLYKNTVSTFLISLNIFNWFRLLTNIFWLYERYFLQ